MGARLSRPGGRGAESPSHVTIAEADSDSYRLHMPIEPGRVLFQSNIRRFLIKKASSAGHLKLEIKGKVENYPFWLSTANLQRQHGDSDRNLIQYYEMGSEKVVTPCAPRLPLYLHGHLDNTMRLVLRKRKSNLSDVKQDIYPEHEIISKSISKILLKVSVSEEQSDPLKLNIKIYEQHRAMRKRHPHHRLREMRVERIMFDKNNNIAFIGKEFALIVYRPSGDHEQRILRGDNSEGVEGVYIRSLDTYPQGLVTFDFKQTSNMKRLEMPSPTNTAHCNEYAKRVLSKSSKKQFQVKLSRNK